MTQTVALTKDQNAGTSADITVTATTPAMLCAYSDSGAPPSGFQCQVAFKTPGGYVPLYSAQDKPVIISQDILQVALLRPGIYQVTKGATSFNLGVTSDQ